MTTPLSMDDWSRFWRKVDKGADCWLWTASEKSTGYGAFTLRKRSVAAHRASWELHFGEIPVGIQVLHRCDNPKCVRPEHLFLGTQRENMWDASRKGHIVQAKLTVEKVIELRAAAKAGVSLAELARRYGVTDRTIAFAINRATWAHVA